MKTLPGVQHKLGLVVNSSINVSRSFEGQGQRFMCLCGSMQVIFAGKMVQLWNGITYLSFLKNNVYTFSYFSDVGHVKIFIDMAYEC